MGGIFLRLAKLKACLADILAFILVYYMKLMLYTHNHHDIDNNGTTNAYSNTGAIQRQADFVVSGTNAFINFLTSVHRHEERDTILTMLTILSDPTNALRIPWCLRSLLVEIKKTQLHLQWSNLNFNSSMAENSILCLHGPMSTFNSRVFKILKKSAHLFWAWRHPHSSPCLGFYYDNGDCHILCTQV